MDSHGVLGMEVFAGSSPCSYSSALTTSDVESISKRSLLSSHFLKLGRSERAEEDDQRCPKISRPISHSCASNGEKMLSFSSPKSHSLALAPLPSLSAASHYQNGGLNSEDINVRMKGAVRGSSGPFTLFQKMELKQQMLIYNHIWANVPIPTNLLSSLMRGLNPSLLSVCSTGSLRPNAAWWGYFHPGYVGNADPEPGRCCRTDGKKWRCSRDAVPDQKYCERHINRGRHRSRKPVEGHGGHAKKAMSIVVAKPTTTSSSVYSAGHSSNSIVRHQVQKCQASANGSSSHFWTMTGRNAANNSLENAQDHSITSTANPFNSFASSINYNPMGETTSLALNSGNGLMNNLRTPLMANNNSFLTSLGNVVDDWSPNFERTKLSMPVSFPPISSGFSSSSSSCPVGQTTHNHLNWKSASSWEASSASMGGPLGEALSSKSKTTVDENKNFLNLFNGSWDLSLQIASTASNCMHSTTVSSVSSGSANDDNVEKNSEGLSCLFAPKVVSSLNLPPFVSM